jgi:hypothetical protein
LLFCEYSARDAVQADLANNIGNTSTYGRSIEIAIVIEAALFERSQRTCGQHYTTYSAKLLTELKHPQSGQFTQQRLLVGQIRPSAWVEEVESNIFNICGESVAFSLFPKIPVKSPKKKKQKSWIKNAKRMTTTSSNRLPKRKPLSSPRKLSRQFLSHLLPSPWFDILLIGSISKFVCGQVTASPVAVVAAPSAWNKVV